MIKQVSILALVLLTACKDSGSSNEVEANVRVFAERKGAAIMLSNVTWSYVNESGQTSGLQSIDCDPDDNGEMCDYIDIGFEAQGMIEIYGIHYLFKSEFCELGYVGTVAVDANPGEFQVLIVNLEEEGGACT